MEENWIQESRNSFWVFKKCGEVEKPSVNSASENVLMEDLDLASVPVDVQSIAEVTFTDIPDDDFIHLQNVLTPVEPVGTYSCKICELFTGDLGNLYAHVLINHHQNWRNYSGKDTEVSCILHTIKVLYSNSS